MKVAGRFKPCAHMGCFDLETFVELNQRSRKASDTINLYIIIFYFYKICKYVKWCIMVAVAMSCMPEELLCRGRNH